MGSYDEESRPKKGKKGERALHGENDTSRSRAERGTVSGARDSADLYTLIYAYLLRPFKKGLPEGEGVDLLEGRNPKERVRARERGSPRPRDISPLTGKRIP